MYVHGFTFLVCTVGLLPSGLATDDFASRLTRLSDDILGAQHMQVSKSGEG